MSHDPSTIASDPAVSAWVAAHAGAGKTYTLANRVSRLLLADARPEKILCLTFTKAAAAEMQHRLFRQLGEWAMLPDDALREKIAAIGGDAATPLPKARKLFASALETPGGLKVLTLHAFCQMVLSRFPLEAGIPPGFEVLDEQSAREMIGESRRRILERAGSGDALLAAAVAHLVTETGEARLTAILDAALGGERRKLDRLAAESDDVAAMVRQAHGVGSDETAHGVAQDFCAVLARDIEQLRIIQAWLAGGSAADLKTAARLAAVLATNLGAQGFGPLGEFLLTDKGEPRKTLATKKLADARPDLMAYLIALQDRFCSAAEKRRAVRAADLGIAALTVINAVRRNYDEAKRRRGVLDYDDLIVKTRALLHKAGAAAWVLYKLDGGIDHVLIDEAQDTSPDQWDIVRKLTEEFFAGTGRERKFTRTIFAVGDEKQSIFSFQGADPAQFDINRHYFAQLAKDAGHAFIDQPLTTSRRSAPQILSFVDAVFASDTARAALTSGGGVIAHQAHRQEAKGGIEFWPALKPDLQDENDPWQPVDAVQAQSPAARLARQVANKIAHWISTGARLPGHDAPIQPRDIMILLPRREPFGGEVIRQLKLRDIAVAGADRVTLTEQIAVMDMIALGRFVLQRDDDLNLAALLRSPLAFISEEELFRLCHGRRDGLWHELVKHRNASPALAAAHEFLSQMLERADYAPPFEFYAHALITRGGKERLLARLGPEAADAIEEFLSLALAHERGATPSLEGFLAWIERGGTQIKRDMERGRNEVRVMTVHGAKGLEADIVILPDTTSQPGGINRHDGLLYSADGILFALPKDEAPQIVQAAKAQADAAILREHRRLLYVALTRARDRLYVCGFEGKRGAREESWYSQMRDVAQSLGVAQGDGETRVIGTVEDEQGNAAIAAPPPDAMPGWVRAAPAAEPPSMRVVSPSDIAGAPAPFAPGTANSARFRRGLVVHALLARLPDIAPERRAAIALAFVTARGFAGDAAAALVREILAVLDNPVFAAAFGPGSRAETAILADVPGLGRINGRIDRLAISDNQVLILDFKTNRPPSARAEDVAPVYLAQMALYRAGAARIFPGRRIVSGLVFTDGPSLLDLPDAILDAALAEIARNQGKTTPP